MFQLVIFLKPHKKCQNHSTRDQFQAFDKHLQSKHGT